MNDPNAEPKDDQPMPEDDKGWRSPMKDESEGHGWRSPGTGDEDEKDQPPDPEKGRGFPAAEDSEGHGRGFPATEDQLKPMEPEKGGRIP